MILDYDNQGPIYLSIQDTLDSQEGRRTVKKRFSTKLGKKRGKFLLSVCCSVASIAKDLTE